MGPIDASAIGTTSLLAALDVATGKVIGQLKRHLRSAEFLQFLSAIDASVPADLEIHLIMDNKTDRVRAWFASRPRYHVHFTPTSASWLNLVEHFFSTLSEKGINLGAHTSVADPEMSIRDYLDRHNADPKPEVSPRSRQRDQRLAAVWVERAHRITPLVVAHTSSPSERTMPAA